MNTITFTFDVVAGEGRILGGGWDVRYQGYADALAAWMGACAVGITVDGVYVLPSFWPMPFQYGWGPRVRCVVCGATGYGTERGDPNRPWQARHQAGHPHECPDCGRRFATPVGLSAHRNPRRRRQP